MMVMPSYAFTSGRILALERCAGAATKTGTRLEWNAVFNSAIRSNHRSSRRSSSMTATHQSLDNRSNKGSSSSDNRDTSSTTTVCQRSAVRVQDVVRERHNVYLERIRETHDPALHLKTLEEELASTIGQALRKQSDKILHAMQQMLQHEQHYQQALHQLKQFSQSPKKAQQQLQAANVAVTQHNIWRQRALQARWEMIVHRQAAGFTVGNHALVMKYYPIGPALPPSTIN